MKTLLYIGCTENLSSRWQRHHLLPLFTFLSGLKVDVFIDWWVASPSDLEALRLWEEELITLFRPPCNGYGKSLFETIQNPSNSYEYLHRVMLQFRKTGSVKWDYEA